MKKILLVLSLGLLLFAVGCSKEEASGEEDKKKIVVGFGVGSYEEQFRESILPILDKKGYSVIINTFSQNMQLNPALKEGSIDASIFQSTAYMEGINEELKMDMTRIAFVPGAPQGLYSVNHTSLDEVKDGSTVAIPSDPVNQERAVRIMEELGWVKIAEDAGTTDFNMKSVSADQYDIDFKVLDPAQILVSLADVDFGVINGNYIANSPDWKITDALKIENTPEEHRIIVSLLSKDKDTQWAKDLKEAYESVQFEAYITAQEKYNGFVLPEAWETN